MIVCAGEVTILVAKNIAYVADTRRKQRHE